VNKILRAAATLIVAGSAISVVVGSSATPVAAAPIGYEQDTTLAAGNVNIGTRPEVSQDGLWTVYLSASGELHSVPTAGGRDRVLDTSNTDSVISPDSSRIAYVDDVGIASQAIAGSAEVRLFTGTDVDALGITSNGRHVVFRAMVPGGGARFDVWSVPIDGGTPVRLNPALTGTGTVETWKSSPDGQTIVFRASLNGSTFDMFKVPTDGGAATQLNPPVPAGGKVENFIEFSPDGRYILFAGPATDASRDDLYSVGPDGAVHRLSTNATNFAFSYHLAIDNDRAVLAAGPLLLGSGLDGSGIEVLTTATATESINGDIEFSPTTGRIVFGLFDGGSAVVDSIRNDGTDRRRLLTDTDGPFNYELTPDGNTVVAKVLTGTGDVRRAAVDGSGSSVLLPFPADVLGINATGSTAILQSPSNVWVADVNGAASFTEVTSISGTTDLGNAAVSPDGRRILLVLDRFVDGDYGIVSFGPSYADGEHSRFVPVQPARILDTRPAELVGYTGSKPGPGAVVELQVRGVGGVPDIADVKSVVLNVTAVDATARGFVTAWPAGSPRPLASNLNVEVTGQNRANLVTVNLSATGSVSLFTNSGTHLVADVAGYYTFAANATDGRMFPLPPTRVLDTRAGVRPAADSTITLGIRGRGGVPSTGVSAVILNVTAVNSTAKGFVTVWPSGSVRPLASNLNLERTGQTIPNQVIVPIGADGKVNLYTDQGTHLVVDVAGWFSNGEEGTGNSGLFRVLNGGSLRMLDTRPDSRQLWAGPKPGPGTVVPLTYSSIGDGTSAYAANVTMVDATGPGFVTAYPADQARPLASNLNSDAVGRTIANHVTVATGRPALTVSLFTNAGTHLIGDIIGVYRS
jgi:Tol biopolymer transport system component